MVKILLTVENASKICNVSLSRPETVKHYILFYIFSTFNEVSIK